jgi:uncharacterized protein (DUF58 family)
VAASRLTFPLVPRLHAAGVAFGTMRSRRRGTGSDTASLRTYLPGDDVRRIDWSASARMSAVRGRDEFVVREDYAEQARSVVLALDCGPSLGLYPAGSPWLCKPRAVAACAELIAGSARAEHCPLLLLDDGGLSRPERHGRNGVARAVSEVRFDAEPGSFTRLLESLALLRVPRGSFVFCLSDFLADAPEALWRRVLATGVELIPVVIQDSSLERSFPAVGGVHLPVAEPGGGAHLVRISRSQAQAQHERNESRFAALTSRFAELGLDWVEAGDEDVTVLHAGFLAWAQDRLRRRRWAAA